MRPSKLRLPLSTAATTRLSFCTACGHVLGQRTAVADAGGAAEADQVEIELLRGRASGRLRGSNRSPPSNPARGSSSPTASPSSPRSTAFFATRPAASITLGFDVLVQLVIAAITTAPLPKRVRRRERLRHRGTRRGSSCFTSGSSTRSCGRFGPAIDGVTVGQIEFQRVGEDRVGRLVGAEEPLLLGVRLHQRDQLRRRGW